MEEKRHVEHFKVSMEHLLRVMAEVGHDKEWLIRNGYLVKIQPIRKIRFKGKKHEDKAKN